MSRARARAGTVGSYCLVGAHARCPSAAWRCACTCHRAGAELAAVVDELRLAFDRHSHGVRAERGRLVVTLLDAGWTAARIAEAVRQPVWAIHQAATVVGHVTRPDLRAEVYVDEHGRRICPDCRTLLVKKNPNGPGRYPRRCADCKKKARA